MAIAYKSYVASRRFVHMTDAFRAAVPEIANIVAHYANMPTSQVKLLDGAALAATKHRYTTARAAELLVLASFGEFQARPPALHGIKYVLFERMARELVMTPNQSRSKLGLCDSSSCC